MASPSPLPRTLTAIRRGIGQGLHSGAQLCVWLKDDTIVNEAIGKASDGKVMSDPRLADLMDPKAMPFDGARMFWGGFSPIVAYDAD